MRRSSELESVHQEAETVLCLLVCEAQDLKHPLLDLAVMDPDGSAADFVAVEDYVVSVCLNLCKGFLVV